MKPDDQDLIRRLRSGDGAAFERLAERYYPVCLRFAEQHLGRPDDAEDVVQDAMVRAYRTLRRGRAPERFRPWLLRIVLNRCRSAIVRRARQRALSLLWFAREEAERGRSQAAPEDPEEMNPALRRALATLSPLLREAFLLKHVEELSYEEMEKVTGAKVSALKMRVKRASELLLRMLEEDT